MKRPFAVVGITYLIAQTIAVLCGFAVTAALLCMTLLCALVVFAVYRERPVWLLPVLVSCVVCFGMSTGHWLLKVKAVQPLQGQTVLISGRVCEAPYQSYGRYYCIIETDSVLREDMPQSVRFRLSSAVDLCAKYGDIVTTEVRFGYMDESTVAARLLRAEGVLLTGHLPFDAMPEVSGGKPSLYGSIIGMRDGFSAAASGLMGEELGGLLTGMFTGDTSGIDNVTLARFRECGLSHLFSVSGLHLSILTAAVILLLRRLTPDYRATALMCIPFVVLFAAFSGFSMSIRRAGIMTLLALTAEVVRREYDPINSLGFAALVICLLNPCAAGDAGMLMSFAGTAGLITMYAPLNRRVRALVRFDPKSRFAFILRPVLGTLTSSVVAQVFTLPISVLCFGEMSLTAPLANVLCIFPAAAFMIIGALAAAVYCIPLVGSVLGFVLLVPAWAAGRLCTVITGFLARIPGSGLSVSYPFMGIMVGAALVLVLVWFVLFRRERSRAYSLMFCCALVLEIVMCSVGIYNGAAMLKGGITVFGSDSGIMTALSSGGQCVIIGCGADSYRGWLAGEQLARDNIGRVLAVALPNNTERYAEYACELIEQYEPDAVFLSDEGSRYELIAQSCLSIDADMYHTRDASYTADGCGISFRTFTDSRNMVWTLAESAGVTMLMCPEKGDCMLLPEEYLHPDIAVMCADGVINPTFIEPIAVIVSAETDQAKRAAAQLEYRGVKNVIAVPDDGSVVVSRSGQGIRIKEQ